jgi:hypothetical protein
MSTKNDKEHSKFEEDAVSGDVSVLAEFHLGAATDLNIKDLPLTQRGARKFGSATGAVRVVVFT